jgi:predicted RNA-binding Zn ribbon-like protein
MTTPSRDRPPARFIADHLALDFLNSHSTPSGIWTDWLADGADLLAWLEEAGAIEAGVAARFRTKYRAHELDAVARQARDLREWLRAFVKRHAGRELSARAIAALAPLNRVLARDDSYTQVGARKDPPDADGLHSHAFQTQRLRRWSAPERLLQPIAEAIADLICHADFRRIRGCDGSDCKLMFLDRTKAHARRWCSMATCGNRAKVAAHRGRAVRSQPAQ